MHIKIIIIILTLEQCFVHIIWTHGTAQGLLEEKQALSHKTKHKKREKGTVLKSKAVSLTLTTKLHRQKYDTKEKVMPTALALPLDQTDIILENISSVKNRFPDLPGVEISNFLIG